MFIYGNWSAYDELSDSVILDEGLAMKQMEHLLRLRNHGVRFDAYLMDAFWYDPSGSYRTWRKSTWPNGPAGWLQACDENQLLPGLWFTANTLFHMDLPEAWANSIDSKNWGLCLFEGGFLDDFIQVLTRWYREGIRIFKLDFAEFEAVPAHLEGTISKEEARERNISAYRSALLGFKAVCPEAIIMGFNGFDEKVCMDRSDNPPGRYIDPDWLQALDSVYCGDPRPSDLPSEFWRSVDVYSDCMTRLFESSGIPLERIDNCGFMAGPTGTCYWRGKAGWKEMLILSLARGGKYHVSYGDLGLFTDEDAEWWAKTQALFAPFLEGGETEAVGGWPGNGETYGWTSRIEGQVVSTCVNPSLDFRSLEIEGASLELRPGEVVLIAEGEVQRFTTGLSTYDEEVIQQDSNVGEELFVQLGAPVNGRFMVAASQFDNAGRAARAPGQLPIQIQIETDQGWQDLPPMSERPIWSGMSWALNQFEGKGLKTIRVRSKSTEPVMLKLVLKRSSKSPQNE